MQKITMRNELMQACRERKNSQVKKLIEQGCSVNFLDDELWSPLAFASSDGNLALVQILISKGAVIDFDGHSALIEASREGHLEIVQFLIENGADPFIEDGAPFLQACSHGNLDILLYLLSIDYSIKEFGGAGLVMAAEHGAIEIVKVLLERGADINYDSGRALIVAIPDFEMVQLLVENGINVNGVDSIENFSPLMVAIHHNHLGIVRYLLDYGADLHFRDDEALMVACSASSFNKENIDNFRLNITSSYDGVASTSHGSLEIVKVLLEHGADVSAQNWRAFDIAQFSENRNLINLLSFRKRPSGEFLREREIRFHKRARIF